MQAQPRKSQLFLNGVFPVKDTHDEVIKKKLKPGKFVFTPTGIIKAIGLVFLLGAVTFFLAAGTCSERDNAWHKILFITANGVAIIVAFVLYMIFSLGHAAKRPWVLVKIYIILNIIFPIIALICSIVAVDRCTKETEMRKLAVPFSITGNVCLLVSAAAIFLLYRYREDEMDDRDVPQTPQKEQDIPRKSIFA